MSGAPAAQRWRAELEGWRIPDEILSAAPESPFGFPVEMFRAHPQAQGPATPSRQRAAEALDGAGSVLDVGCGGGAASLAVVPPATLVTGVDSSAEMLAEFAAAAERAGVDHREILASWPAEAAAAPIADVVVCHHLAYNVADLPALAAALTAHARRRVVLELTARHPLTATTPLWWRFHRLPRPDGPTAALAGQVLAEAGIQTSSESFLAPPRQVDFRTLVGFTRRRLCLPPSYDEEVAAALAELDPDGPREMVTIWWDGRAERNGR